MSTRDFKRVLVLSDTHCGHELGLTHPDFDAIPTDTSSRRYEHYMTRRKMWAWATEKIDALKPINILIFNGDAIEGKGTKSGGTELITSDRVEQVDMATAAIEEVEAEEIYMSYGCLTPGHRVLTADLRWVPVETLASGDTVIGFDAQAPGNGLKRQLYPTTVLANEPSTASVYRLTLSDGSTIEASEEHPFLIRRGAPYKWYTVKQLYEWMYYSQGEDTHRPSKNGERNENSPIRFARFIPVWDTLDSYVAGYLAGFFDADGNLNQSRKQRRSGWPEHVFRLSVSQNPNAALKVVLANLEDLEFPHRVVSPRGRKIKRAPIMGGRMEGLRFLGSVRPKRLLDRFDPGLLGTVRNPYQPDLWITKIEPLGEREVCALGTECGTYISEGFLSHNTPYHAGRFEDWEDQVAKQVKAKKIGGEDSLSVGWQDVPEDGLIFNYRHKVGRSTVPYSRATAVLKEKLWNGLWAARGEYPKAQIIIRSHVHYMIAVFEPGESLSLVTPALQAYGSKFGGRQCTGEVHFGFCWFDVWHRRKWIWDYKIMKLKRSQEVLLAANR